MAIIDYYTLHWNKANSRGYIELSSNANGQEGQIPVTSLQDLAAAHLILSSTNEIDYDARTGELGVGQNAVGQGVKTKPPAS